MGKIGGWGAEEDRGWGRVGVGIVGKGWGRGVKGKRGGGGRKSKVIFLGGCRGGVFVL